MGDAAGASVGTVFSRTWFHKRSASSGVMSWSGTGVDASAAATVSHAVSKTVRISVVTSPRGTVSSARSTRNAHSDEASAAIASGTPPKTSARRNANAQTEWRADWRRFGWPGPPRRGEPRVGGIVPLDAVTRGVEWPRKGERRDPRGSTEISVSEQPKKPQKSHDNSLVACARPHIVARVTRRTHTGRSERKWLTANGGPHKTSTTE